MNKLWLIDAKREQDLAAKATKKANELLSSHGYEARVVLYPIKQMTKVEK